MRIPEITLIYHLEVFAANPKSGVTMFRDGSVWRAAHQRS